MKNSQLSLPERQKLKGLANNDAQKEARLTDVACALVNSMSASASAINVGINMQDGKYALAEVIAGNALNNGSASQQATPYFQATIRQYNDPTFFATAQPSNYYDRQLLDYMTIQGGAFGASGSLSLNLHNGDAFVGGSKTNISSSPGGSLTFGTMLDQPPANVPRATAVSNMLDGGGVQAGACAFVMCIGVNQSLAPNGQPRPTAIEWGLGTPGASVGTGASFPVGRPK
jgi:hypothetical protein